MREVIYKNLTSINLRKKDIVLKEVFERNGVVAKTERRCFYFIRDVTHLGGEGDLQKWLSDQNNVEMMNKRNFHILKEHSDLLGEDKIICKIVGTFYAVLDKDVYTIGFLHSFKVSFARAAIS